jgi:ATP-dependent Clp protease ATP-binding subunit ClpA
VQDAYTDVRVDFTKTVIIITSNLAHKRCANIAQTVEDPDARTKAFRDIFVQNGFREEMLNRIPAIIYFAELPPRQQAEIGAMRITQIAQDYGLEVTDIAVEVLAELVGAVMTNAGGARQIQQLLEKALRRDLADLSGARCRGGPAMIRVVLQDGLIRAVADAAPRRTAPGSSNTP